MNQQADIVKELQRFIDEKERLRKVHPLKYLFWESTLRCNLSCHHCGSDCVKDDSTEGAEIPAQRVKDELIKVAAACDPSEITFAIIGGEPLVRLDDLVDVGAFAADLGFFWGITTNGTLLTDQTIAKLKAANLKTISVSVDGIETDHNQLRNSPHAYRKTIAGIRRLLADPFYEKLDVICCVSRININHLDVFLEDMVKIGIPVVRFTPIFAHGRGGDNSDLLLSNEELKSLLEFIAVQRETNAAIGVTLSEEGYYGPEWECRIRDSLHYCGSGITVGTILHDGRVTGCPSVSRELVEGSLHEHSFLDLWQNGFKAYRHDKKEMFDQQCGSCEHWILCEGGGCHLLKQKVTTGHCQLDKVEALS